MLLLFLWKIMNSKKNVKWDCFCFWSTNNVCKKNYLYLYTGREVENVGLACPFKLISIVKARWFCCTQFTCLNRDFSCLIKVWRRLTTAMSWVNIGWRKYVPTAMSEKCFWLHGDVWYNFISSFLSNFYNRCNFRYQYKPFMFAEVYFA